MTVGTMITNGGPHTAEDWAAATASHIVDIADTVSGERRGAAIKLQAAIIDILEGHHTTVQDGERCLIVEHGHARLSHELDSEHHLILDDVVIDICHATVGTPWEADFKKPEMVESLKVLLTSHLATNMQIERQWHTDRNPEALEAISFMAKHNVGGA